MKGNIFYVLAVSFFLSSCYGSGMRGNPAAVQAGASIGGVIGAVIGDRAGGYNGSQFGAILGTVAGAAIGNAATTPKQRYRSGDNRDSRSDRGNRDIYNFNSDNQSFDNQSFNKDDSRVRVSNIRFVDGNNNHIIERDEECKLIFDIENLGNLAAYNVTPYIVEASNNRNIYISSPAQIGYLGPGDVVRYTAVVQGGKRLKSGNANFRVYTVESDGAKSISESFSIPTRKR